MMAIFDNDSESTTTSDGRRVLKDTQPLWDEFKIVVDDDIRNESDGKKAPGGFTWNQRWVGRIETLREGRENPQRYIDHIIEERRRQGLPELTGL